jgi:hypothetical protein
VIRPIWGEAFQTIMKIFKQKNLEDILHNT